MILTSDNYHSKEANRAYMSVSQYKDFCNCEASALAKVNGKIDQDEKECMKVSSYVHAGIEGEEAVERFKEKHPDIFSSRGATKGELKTEYKNAEKMVQVLMDDEMCRSMLEGEKEIIIIAELFGVKWKCRIDVLNEDEGRLTDLKAIKEIRSRHWNEEYRVWESFVQHYGYVTQMSVYTEIERIHSKRFEPLDPFIVAVSKEDDPDKAIICFDEQSLQNELQAVSERLPRIIAVKEGIEEPERCEKCRYCRESKRISGITHYLDLLA